jgi:nucleotide-binding universal stress UspA family protein
MTPIRTILFPTDFSQHADNAFQLACSLARDHGARIVVLHVATPPPIVLPEGVVTEFNVPEYLEGVRRQLEQIKSPDPALRLERRLEQGDPGSEIVRVAKEVGADWIVIGTHGRTGLLRLVLGSVAEQVLRKAPCPVLTVRSAPSQTQSAKPALSEKTGQPA